jgi:Spx/MgsR family transcriptional regulator
MTVTIYGFNACDTVRKARKWLEAEGVEHRYFDYRKERLDPKVVDDWFSRADWETVFNRGSTSFKELPEAQKSRLDAAAARKLILADTNFIKRPVLDTGKALLFGFKPDVYAKALSR